MVPAQNKMVEPTRQAQSFIKANLCSLPVWDEKQIQQENWGAVLAAPRTVVRSGNVTPAKEPRGARGAGKDKDATGAASYTDSEGRAALEAFISACCAESQECGGGAAASREGCTPRISSLISGTQVVVPLDSTSTKSAADGATTSGKEGSSPPMTWRRPVEIMNPFRPIVHRNLTPFLNPYLPTGSLVPTDSKSEEARHRDEVTQGSHAPGKRDGGEHGKESGMGPPLHQQYPEAVSLMDDLVGQDASIWQQMTSEECKRRYREVPALIEPYNAGLAQGLGDAALEKSESRYSTALRHKLQHAEALAALKEIPPFLMSAFNSAVLAVEQSQHVIEKGGYLWELIYPHAPGTCHPVYNPYGKYAVKLYIEGAYRKVLVDDALPVDELGRSFLTVTSSKELWPALLAKAIFKALGAHAHQIFTNDPDVIMACLIGNWVPQYVPTKQDPVSTAALLLSYRLQLPSCKRLASVQEAHPHLSLRSGSNKDTNGPLTQSMPAIIRANDGLPSTDATTADVPNDAAHGTHRNSKKRTSRIVKDDGTRNGELQRLEAVEVCLPNDDEYIDDRPMVVCGLHSNGRFPGTVGVASTQLFSITHVLPFRRTLAIRLVTTPRTDIHEALFQTARDHADVRDILASARLPEDSTNLTVAKHATLTCCWLTLEELTDLVDVLVVWRCMDGCYLHRTSLEYPTDAPVSLPKANQRKGNAATAANTLARTTLGSAAKKHTVMWLSTTSERPEEIAVVAYGPPPLPSAAVEDEPPANTKPLKAAVASKKQPLPTAPPPPTPLSSLSAKTVGVRSCVPALQLPVESKLICLEYYQWDRADPVNQSITAFYNYGKLSCTLMRVPRGSHLFRVTIPELEYNDRITFLSDATMELQSELKDAIKSASIFTVTDAGSYPAVEAAGMEVVWFKRRISVTCPTRVTFVLSTLLPFENAAAHRELPIVPKELKALKGSSPSANRHSVSKVGHANAKDVVGDFDPRVCEIPILRYVELHLVNLDNQCTEKVGRAGRLPQIDLLPNQRGYLLMAYMLIPKEDVSLITAAFPKWETAVGQVSGAESPSAKSANSVPAPSGARDQPNLMYGSGQWNLCIRSNRELGCFEVITHQAHSFTDHNTIDHGGAALLFRHSCTVFENTHVSAMVNLEAEGVPFNVRISYIGGLAAGAQRPSRSSVTNGNTKNVEGVESSDPIAATECVYETGDHVGHVFIPDVLLEVVKGKSTTYMIEGHVSESQARYWGEVYQRAQQKKFREWRVEAEKEAEERRICEMTDVKNSTTDFVARKMEQHRQHLAALEQATSVLKEPSTTSCARGRQNDSKRAPNSSRNVSSRRASLLLSQLGGSTSGGGILAIDNTLAPTDTTDSRTSICFHLEMLFSNSKVDLKNAVPSEDCLYALKKYWSDASGKQDVCSGKDADGSPLLPAATASTTKNISASAKARQRDAAAAEELLRVEQAKQSRQSFLDNPRNVLIPYVIFPEEVTGKEPRGGKDSSRGAPVTSALRVVTGDSDEDLYRHAPILSPEEYSVKLLPLRAMEICPAAGDETIETAAASCTKDHRRAITPRTTGNRLQEQSTSPSVSPTGNPLRMGHVAMHVIPEEEHAALRSPLQRYTDAISEASRKLQEEQKAARCSLIAMGG